MVMIINVMEYEGGLEEAVSYIHGVWGSGHDFEFYSDAITHSKNEGDGLPRFYLMLEDGVIIGCGALLINDMISRQDLYPWFACLYVDIGRRGEGLGGRMLQHGEEEAKKIGFDRIYLSTGHDGYYEKYGWTRIEDGFELTGRKTRIYMKELG